MSQTRIKQVLQYTSKQERKTARNLLIRAKNKLTKVGWTKYNEVERNSKGKPVAYCAIGAIYNSKIGNTKSYNTQHRAVNIATQVVGAVIPKNFTSIAAYNDSRRRTKEQVIDKFDKAIAALDS